MFIFQNFSELNKAIISLPLARRAPVVNGEPNNLELLLARDAYWALFRASPTVWHFFFFICWCLPTLKTKWGEEKEDIFKSFAKLTLHLPKVWTQLVVIWHEIFFFGRRCARFSSIVACFLRRPHWLWTAAVRAWCPWRSHGGRSAYR